MRELLFLGELSLNNYKIIVDAYKIGFLNLSQLFEMRSNL